MKHRTELEKQARLFASLQDQHLQLQQYCVELKDAAHEIQGFLETAERENLQLRQEAQELRELLEVHHIKAMKGNVQVDFAEGESLAQELEDLDDPEAEEMSMNKTKSVQICEEPKPRRKPALRRSSSNVAASKLAALQEEYEEKFESQSQQLQSALLNKERLEREKQEAIESLQKQIEELKGKLPSESGGEALAGLFKMMSKIKELTTEASDAVLLGFAPAEPPAALPKAKAEPKAEALKFSSVAAASAVRNRLQRRQRKTVAGDSIDGDGGYQP
ncbi:unnamed protein product [Effrenium voratum]|nr:unnamed protein product [Effrenium voratum]